MANINKKISFEVDWNVHFGFKEQILFPPHGYEIIAPSGWQDTVFKSASRFYLAHWVIAKGSEILPLNLIKASLERFKKPPQGTELTYSYGHLVFRREPWIVEVECSHYLAGFGIKPFGRCRALIERLLLSPYCKKIICWTEMAEKTFLYNLGAHLKPKIEVVPQAVRPQDFVKGEGGGKVKLLFTGSANLAESGKLFAQKGGKEVLEAFRLLRQRYPDLELVVRSIISEDMRRRYAGLGGLRIVEKLLPRPLLEEEYKTADIFVMPAYYTPEVNFIEAMSFELPIVTTDDWANGERVEDGKTGFVIQRPSPLSYWAEGWFAPPSHSPGLDTAIGKIDQGVVAGLVERISLLIENPQLRREMGRAARREVETGKFSLEKRNQKLKRVFDEATEKVAC